MSEYETWLSKINSLNDEDLGLLHANINEALSGVKFVPSVGPQTEAFFSEADVMLYGGSAGSGKSGLLIGLALTEHRRSLLLRRNYTDLFALTEDAKRLNGSSDGFVGGTRPRLRTDDDRMIEFGAIGENPESWQGQPHDLLGFDEVTQVREADFRYLQTWVRSTIKGQRCRTVAASNPPIDPDGDWVIGYWRPWLDPTYHKPAKCGELRWVVITPDGDDMWVDGPEPVFFNGHPKPVKPESRTFIAGKLSDNPYLADTSYGSKLDSLPEPLRSAMRDGNFMLARKDQDFQVIPTNWIRMAQLRWREMVNKGELPPQSLLSVDPAGGGSDDFVIAPMRGDHFFDTLIAIRGDKVPEQSDMQMHILKERRNGADVCLDLGGGYGGGLKILLSDNDIAVHGYKGAKATTLKDVTKTFGFANVRSAAYWAIREALDPEQEGGAKLALPDDQELLSDLTAPRYETPRIGGQSVIQITTKEKLRDRLGRSTGRGDVIAMGVFMSKTLTKKNMWGNAAKRLGKISVKLGYENRKNRHK